MYSPNGKSNNCIYYYGLYVIFKREGIYWKLINLEYNCEESLLYLIYRDVYRSLLGTVIL